MALVYGHDIYFHERAARGFIAAPDNNLYDIKKYVVSSLDALVLRQIAQAIIDDKLDIIVPIGTSVSRAIVSVLKSRKELIPVVFVGVSQADKVGLVHSLKKPGCNVTGVATFGEESTRAFNILRYLKPTLKKILLPYDALSPGGVGVRMAENIKENLNTHGVHVTLLPINSISEVLERVAGLIADHDTITYLEGDRVGDAFCGLICLCNKYNKTLLALELEASQQGCAISYEVQPDVVGAAALKSVNKILLGKINAGIYLYSFLRIVGVWLLTRQL